MSLDYLHDLASILGHKIEWMMMGTGVSIAGITMPSIAPTIAERQIMDLSQLVITWGDAFTVTGWVLGVVIGYYSVINIRTAIKVNNLNIAKLKKELKDD